jgi:hypothetical protein
MEAVQDIQCNEEFNVLEDNQESCCEREMLVLWRRRLLRTHELRMDQRRTIRQ